jgi:hypothetical protein
MPVSSTDGKRRTLSDHERIRVDLTRDRQGDWPPSDAEWLWARKLVDDRYLVDNIPIYARNVSYGDIVAAKKVNDELHLTKVVKPGGHSTYRVILLNGTSLSTAPARKHWDALARMGCTFEGLQGGPLFAIDVLPDADIFAVYGELKRGEREGVWDFEEANFEHRR